MVFLRHNLWRLSNPLLSQLGISLWEGTNVFHLALLYPMRRGLYGEYQRRRHRIAGKGDRGMRKPHSAVGWAPQCLNASPHRRWSKALQAMPIFSDFLHRPMSWTVALIFLHLNCSPLACESMINILQESVINSSLQCSRTKARGILCLACCTSPTISINILKNRGCAENEEYWGLLTSLSTAK